jgi:hypothetical protein
MRLEGKEYVMKEGDIVNFRFIVWFFRGQNILK